MRRVPRVRQHDQSDCGIACLASVAAHYRQHISIARLRQHAHTSQNGTTLLALSHAARKLGYSATAVRATPSSLANAPLPAIAHVTRQNGGHHYVVLERADANTVWLMDPDGGERRTESRETFDEVWSGALLLLAPESGSTLHETANNRVHILSLAHSHHQALVLAMLMALIQVLPGLAIALCVQRLVDDVLLGHQLDKLKAIAIAMLLVVIARTAISGIRAALTLRAGQQIDLDLILRYHRHLLRLPKSFFDRMGVGELTSRVADAVTIRALLNEAIPDAVASAVLVMATAIMMWSFDWRLALWAISLLTIHAALHAHGGRMSRRRQRALVAHGAALEAHITESLAAVSETRQLRREEETSHETEARLTRLLGRVAEVAKTSIWIGCLASLVSRVNMLGILWLGSSRVLSGGLSAGQLISACVLLALITGPALSLTQFGQVLAEARVAGDRLFGVMELEPEPHSEA